MRLPALLLIATLAHGGEPVVTPVPSKQMKPGYGVVESVTEVQMQVRDPKEPRERSAAAAGGSAQAGKSTKPMYRIAVRMPDGSLQVRDLDRPEFEVGDNVLLTNAGDILPD